MNLPEKLADEIIRVSRLCAQYEELRGKPNVNVEPVILMMTVSLDKSVKAIGSGDIEQQIRAVKDLEGFTG